MNSGPGHGLDRQQGREWSVLGDLRVFRQWKHVFHFRWRTLCYLLDVVTGDLHRIFEALEAARVRYLVVGGVAVVLHGHPRFTADLDLVVALDSGNALAAIHALDALGYRPRAPVPVEQFADASIRRRWIEEKGLTVFSLWSPNHPGTEIDLFVDEPFVFETCYARGIRAELGTTHAMVVSLEDLIEMKRRAGRPRDLEDIAALEAIRREISND
jgi:hypothetical protein